MEAFTEACASLGVNGGPFIAEAFSSQHAEDSPFALFELGHIDTNEFIERIQTVLGKHSAGEVDAHEWYAQVQQTTRRLDVKMVEAVATLSSNGTQTALVSNSWGPVDGYPWARLPTFTQVVVSSEVGIRKPDPAIYRLAADRLQRKVADCVFIDVEVNLAPARLMGMHAILHDKTPDTLTQLNKIYGGAIDDVEGRNDLRGPS
jgi:putative hydrolase of the HAD superfamily